MEVSDVMGMREALESISARASVGGEFDPQAYLDEIREIAEKALAAPPRNCDVGTADEQFNRHDKYCNLQPTCRKYLRENVPSTCIWCFAKWAQQPYKAAQEGCDHGEKQVRST